MISWTMFFFLEWEKEFSSNLSKSRFTDDSVPVNSNSNDCEGGHVDTHTGQTLDQSEDNKWCLTKSFLCQVYFIDCQKSSLQVP